jgi:hypothetical protein
VLVTPLPPSFIPAVIHLDNGVFGWGFGLWEQRPWHRGEARKGTATVDFKTGGLLNPQRIEFDNEHPKIVSPLY